jgi:3,4-dihydroxy 2-butanone 4-phosphate synthase
MVGDLALPPKLQAAIKSVREGKFVLIHDSESRENETDLVIASEFVTPAAIRVLRKDGGGLICTTVHPALWSKLGLPYLAELFQKQSTEYAILRMLIPNDIPYDEHSAFSITINYRKTFTGITDVDRALTISEFAKFLKRCDGLSPAAARAQFGKDFRAPGHVPLLNAAEKLLIARKGHTELATALMVMASVVPTATICEMIGDDGKALSKSAAEEYAKKHRLVFLEGCELVEAWKVWEEKERQRRSDKRWCA